VRVSGYDANSSAGCSLPVQKLNAFLESVMSAGLIEDGTVAADMSKVCCSPVIIDTMSSANIVLCRHVPLYHCVCCVAKDQIVLFLMYTVQVDLGSEGDHYRGPETRGSSVQGE